VKGNEASLRIGNFEDAQRNCYQPAAPACSFNRGLVANAFAAATAETVTDMRNRNNRFFPAPQWHRRKPISRRRCSAMVPQWI
jgi:hypothetical protein